MHPSGAMQRFILAVLLAGALAAAQGATVEDPGLWPEGQRAFLQDGPGLLLSAAEQARLAGLDAAGRAAFIADFLARDPLPATPLNELAEGIRRRTELARSLFFSPADVRYSLVFLNGAPAQRLEIDCGQTFHPLEIWTYPPTAVGARRSLRVQEEVAPDVESKEVKERHYPRRFATWQEGPKLVLYRPTAVAPFRLWQPFDTKRALYNPDMEYLLVQYEELRNLISARRFDLQACPETERVDEATGVLGLGGFLSGRPTKTAIRSFLAPPDDLAAWAQEAAATPVPQAPPALEAAPLAVTFPRRQGQLMAVRLLVTLPPGSRVAAADDGDLKLIVDGEIESDGEPFAQPRVRYRTKPPPAGTPMALALDAALRPGEVFVAHLRVRDETTGAQGWVSGGFQVPAEPQAPPAAAGESPPVVLGEELARQAAAGLDGLLLAPPIEGQVVLGLWNAQALVTGQRIQKVVFSVDGKPQLTRTRAPWVAEVRLATHPTEQVVRAEGFDADGVLVAADEVILNQPRGSFRVSIIQPQKGAVVAGEVEARAEVVVPDEGTVQRVEFLLNDQLVETLEKPPWIVTVTVPSGGEVSYLAAVAYLDDGSRAEDVRFLNAPKYLEEVDVRLVELYTTVTDRSGRLVRGLGVDDFEVREEGRPQKVTKFELVENLPLTVGITIDTSGSMASSLVEAQRAGRAFLEHVVTRPRDRCFVVGFSGKASLLMPPTDDVEACSQGLEGLQAVGWTALHDAVVTSLYYMRELQGQRALVLLSDGDDTASGIAFDDALEYARRSGVVIFPVGLNVSALELEIRHKLSHLAEETGGRTFFINNADELAGVYGEIEAELRSRYLLAYSPDQPGQEQAYRQVEVKVHKRGLTARTIRGYYY
jgi:Ca-activated chloride channel homolog